MFPYIDKASNLGHHIQSVQYGNGQLRIAMSGPKTKFEMESIREDFYNYLELQIIDALPQYLLPQIDANSDILNFSYQDNVLTVSPKVNSGNTRSRISDFLEAYSIVLNQRSGK